jgi:hypothetical protein
MLANLLEGEGQTPISSSWRTAARHSCMTILCVPIRRRVWRTPSCGAQSINHAFSNPGAWRRKKCRWATIRRRDSISTAVRSSTSMAL